MDYALVFSFNNKYWLVVTTHITKKGYRYDWPRLTLEQAKRYFADYRELFANSKHDQSKVAKQRQYLSLLAPKLLKVPAGTDLNNYLVSDKICKTKSELLNIPHGLMQVSPHAFGELEVYDLCEKLLGESISEKTEEYIPVYVLMNQSLLGKDSSKNDNVN